MLRMIKIGFIYFAGITKSQSDIIPLRPPGSQTDEHNCVLDGGYQWCESSQRCERPWETPCMEQVGEVDFCSKSNIQTCRMACQEPECQSSQCALRVGNCCDYTCISQEETVNVCPDRCPPPAPCPMPAVAPTCRLIEPTVDHCGCSSGCPTIDCSRVQNTVGEGESCGGYMPYGMSGVCNQDLECVYRMGPLIADAPGTCEQVCNTVRDSWGNCVIEGCNHWYDGCNSCEMDENRLICTEKMCSVKKDAYCLDDTNEVPRNCITWYDGCNTCSVNDGNIGGCTMMYCFTTNEPYCQAFTSGELRYGEICYRFCEDGSQNSISRVDDCPTGSVCLDTNPSMISFDNCGENVKRCVPSNGH